MVVRAIVIDDDYDLVETLCQYLEIKGFDVIGRGYNGQEATALFEQLTPDVVFLDVMMPYYDGFYALEKIRVLDPDALIIMITADIRPETQNKLKNLAASTIIPKPFDFSKMSVIVENLVSHK